MYAHMRNDLRSNVLNQIISIIFLSSWATQTTCSAMTCAQHCQYPICLRGELLLEIRVCLKGVCVCVCVCGGVWWGVEVVCSGVWRRVEGCGEV